MPVKVSIIVFASSFYVIGFVLTTLTIPWNFMAASPFRGLVWALRGGSLSRAGDTRADGKYARSGVGVQIDHDVRGVLDELSRVEEAPERLSRSVSLSLALRYGTGYIGIAIATQTVLLWLAYFYAPPADSGLAPLLPVSWVGLAMLVGRIVDGIADPLVGAWSDATRTRIGRRRPFMIWGALPLAATFAALWWAPTPLSDVGRVTYLTVMVSAFLFFFTVYTAPYLALLPELSTTLSGRVRLATWQAVAQIVGLGIAMIGSGILIDSIGFGGMGLALAGITLATYLVTALTVREEVRAHASTPGLLQSMALTLRNRPFLYYVGSHVLFWFGFNAVVTAAPYLVTVRMGGEELHTSIALATTFVVALATFPLVGRITQVRGLKFAMQASMGALVAALVLWGFVGHWPGGVSPFWQGMAVFIAAGFSIGGLFAVPNAVVAEIVDYDEHVTGMRREAMFFGVQGLLVKIAMGLSAFVATQVLELGGFSLEKSFGVQWLGPLAALFVAAGMAVFAGYPEDEVRAARQSAASTERSVG